MAKVAETKKEKKEVQPRREVSKKKQSYPFEKEKKDPNRFLVFFLFLLIVFLSYVFWVHK